MKITFSTKDDIDAKLNRDGFTATLTDPFDFIINGDKDSVPAGFSTDWASVPQLFWNIIPPMDMYSFAALVHDYLYRFRLFNGKAIKRSFADSVFLAAMKFYKVSAWRRQTMYWAVKCFGWSAWRANRKKR